MKGSFSIPSIWCPLELLYMGWHLFLWFWIFPSMFLSKIFSVLCAWKSSPCVFIIHRSSLLSKLPNSQDLQLFVHGIFENLLLILTESFGSFSLSSNPDTLSSSYSWGFPQALTWGIELSFPISHQPSYWRPRYLALLFPFWFRGHGLGTGWEKVWLTNYVKDTIINYWIKKECWMGKGVKHESDGGIRDRNMGGGGRLYWLWKWRIEGFCGYKLRDRPEDLFWWDRRQNILLNYEHKKWQVVKWRNDQLWRETNPSEML